MEEVNVYNEKEFEYDPKQDFESNFIRWYQHSKSETEYYNRIKPEEEQKIPSVQEAKRSFLIMFGHHNVV
jgi:hypothetical protein